MNHESDDEVLAVCVIESLNVITEGRKMEFVLIKRRRKRECSSGTG